MGKRKKNIRMPPILRDIPHDALQPKVDVAFGSSALAHMLTRAPRLALGLVTASPQAISYGGEGHISTTVSHTTSSSELQQLCHENSAVERL
jgi:hypothetical protein